MITEATTRVVYFLLAPLPAAMGGALGTGALGGLAERPAVLDAPR